VSTPKAVGIMNLIVRVSMIRAMNSRLMGAVALVLTIACTEAGGTRLAAVLKRG
jgi:hypothetical protein